jgi:hypothetical protein
MTHGRFDRRLPLPSSGRVTVKGPFNPQDSKVGSAKVLFLIVQGEGDDAVIVNGEDTWNRRAFGCALRTTKGAFCSRTPACLPASGLHLPSETIKRVAPITRTAVAAIPPSLRMQ